EKGIEPSMPEDPSKKHWWIHGDNNWNQVCHAGMVAAAVAVGNRHPELARTVIQRALDNLPRAAEAYAPDGAYAEGPMYWGYGTSFHIFLADALLQLSGSTFGTDGYPGFMESAGYIRQMTAPSGRFFCYSDCD